MRVFVSLHVCEWVCDRARVCLRGDACVCMRADARVTTHRPGAEQNQRAAKHEASEDLYNFEPIHAL